MKRKPTVKEFIQCVNYHISDGYDYLWACYGIDAFGLMWEAKDLVTSSALVFDKRTQIVYEMAVWDGHSNKVYRWIKPEFLSKYKKECKSKGLKFNTAYDRVKYEDVAPSRIMRELKRIVAKDKLSSARKPKKVTRKGVSKK